MDSAEARRLDEDARREKNWKRWGPYLAERQWATVREDYSADGECWGYFPHEQARSRTYRWGEDGLLGFCDRQCRLCFALALWNGSDPILKERLFGLTGPEGNHGEDVKECYFYLDSTPTHSYVKALYKYPQREFPYEDLRRENRRRTRADPEYDLEDTGTFDDGRYFDVFVEYAKADPDDTLIQVTVANRGPETKTLHLLPTLWFRNTWSWGRAGEEHGPRPVIRSGESNAFVAEHVALGMMRLEALPVAGGPTPEQLFTENETNVALLFGDKNRTPYVKDAFHEYVVRGNRGAVCPERTGTKAAFLYRLEVPAAGEVRVRLRLSPEDDSGQAIRDERIDFDALLATRIRESDEFYANKIPASLSLQERNVARQSYAGLMTTKQFYHYIVRDWLEGDPAGPPPPEERKHGRNAGWLHLYSRDVISVPDKWEYPWFAAWDLAFHMVSFARVDPDFAKSQLLLFLREWYMHPNGQLPAYEFALGDVNPPVHAWAAWQVYLQAPAGHRDRRFLSRVFQKLLLNFTWWVNRKDARGNNLFSGGFLGLDNIGVFDRSKPLPTGGSLEQADGTAWMAFYCATMLEIALELARGDSAYEDLASKFFEHFVAITDAMNTLGKSGLWNEHDGYYYDQLVLDDGRSIPLRVRSMVGIIPLFAVAIIDSAMLSELHGFAKRMRWFLQNRTDLALHTAARDDAGLRLLAIPSRERLQRVLRYVLDESEFLSPYGVRSMSRMHKDNPYVLHAGGEEFRVSYVPGESDTGLFGGNSNWRGPIWFPVNYLLVQALEKYHDFYGDTLRVECPVGSGRQLTLREVAQEISRRLASIFLPDATGRRPMCGSDKRWHDDAHWRDLVLFHEYFDGDTGRGCGASHQTGWTALVTRLFERTNTTSGRS